MLVAVAGCVAQAEGEEIIARAAGGGHGGGAAILSPPAGNDRARWRAARARRWKPIFPRWKNSMRCPKPDRDTGVSAFLTVQEGCDKFCTFCVVPYTRGAGTFAARRNRFSPKRARWSARGAREIMLLGPERQRLSRHGRDGKSWSLARLIEALAGIEDVLRIRYTTSHPRDMGDDLIAGAWRHRKADAVPASAGAVGFGQCAGGDEPPAHGGRLSRLVERIRAPARHRALVGFHRRLSRRERCGFRGHPGTGARGRIRAMPSRSNTAPRPGTPAAAAKKQIAESVKSARLEALQKLLLAQQDAVEQSRDRQDPGRAVRKARPWRRARLSAARRYLHPVHVEAPAVMIGTVRPVRIEALTANSLKGTLV